MRFPTRFPAHMVLVGALAVALAGCAAPGGPNETGGMVVGGVLGGALGSQAGYRPGGCRG
jgi:hypothetical protein